MKRMIRTLTVSAVVAFALHGNAADAAVFGFFDAAAMLTGWGPAGLEGCQN